MHLNRLTGFAGGAVAGVAGLAVMNLYWKAATRLAGHDPRLLTTEGEHRFDEVDVAGRQTEGDEPSTAAVGRIAYEAVTGDEPDEKTHDRLSEGVHWGYGIAVAGLYGMLRGGHGGTDLSGGLAYGTALWLLGDELMVPVLGLSKGPTAYPVEQHVHRLGAHLAFGVATAVATQTLLGALHRATRPKRSVWGVGWKAAKTAVKWKALAGTARLAARRFRH